MNFIITAQLLFFRKHRGVGWAALKGGPAMQYCKHQLRTGQTFCQAGLPSDLSLTFIFWSYYFQETSMSTLFLTTAFQREKDISHWSPLHSLWTTDIPNSSLRTVPTPSQGGQACDRWMMFRHTVLLLQVSAASTTDQQPGSRAGCRWHLLHTSPASVPRLQSSSHHSPYAQESISQSLYSGLHLWLSPPGSWPAVSLWRLSESWFTH